MAILVSVVVCTYNRAGLLRTVLESLSRQTLARSLYEIIVVDNNSTDDTKAVVADYSQLGNVRYSQETRQGLSHARNLGWQSANGEYVGYIDDDAKAPVGWLAAAQNVITNIRPIAFGGPYHAFYSDPKPRWFQDRYASSVKSDVPRVLVEGEYLTGTNMFFRRSLFETVGGFDPELGMSGEKMAYGEETELLNRIRHRLPDDAVYYDPGLFVHHLVRPARMLIHRVARDRFIDGRYAQRVLGCQSREKLKRRWLLEYMSRTVLYLGWDVGRSAIWRDRRRYPYWQNYLYERGFDGLLKLGGLYEQYTRRTSKECAGCTAS